VRLSDSIAKALTGSYKPLSGRDVGQATAIPYKAAIDALCGMHDVGSMVRIGRK